MGIGPDDDHPRLDETFAHHLVADPASGIREWYPGNPGKRPKFGLERCCCAGVCRDDVVEDQAETLGARESFHPHLAERFQRENAGAVVGEGYVDVAVDVCPRRCAQYPL